MVFEEDTYTEIFQALRHPIRRAILNLVTVTPSTYTEILNMLGVETGLLNYHLESLRSLITKNSESRYQLSKYGQAAVSLIQKIEVPEIRVKETRNYTLYNVLFALIIGILTIGIVLTTFSMIYTENRYIDGYEYWNNGNTVYPPNLLIMLEKYTDAVGTKYFFWWEMNDTVDIYVMTSQQYREQREMHSPPMNYLIHYEEKEGNITVVQDSTPDGSDIVDYKFTMYTGEKGIRDIQYGLKIYRMISYKRVDNILQILDGILLLSITGLIVLNHKIADKLEKYS